SVFDIFGALAAGSSIVIPDDSRDPASWFNSIRAHSVSIWNSVPALMQLLADYLLSHSSSLPSLRLALLSGDWIPLNLPSLLNALFDNLQIVSLGGATEASIWSVFFPISHVSPDWSSIPYGKPLLNQSLHVLNQSLSPCPVWVPGDLYIGGSGLALGYWNDSLKTQASFISLPSSGQRLYKTGDLARFLPDGNIEFLGRQDSQVKIHGYRVELAEIEAALLRHPAVLNAVVLAKGDKLADKHLVAYIVPDPQATPPLTITDAKAAAASFLPDYMVPSKLILLDSLPLTQNGKVDRAALLDLSPADQSGTDKAREPDTIPDGLTQAVIRLVAEVLKVDTIDPGENLLELGANSVEVIRIINVLESEFGLRMEPDDFFQSPTVSGIARLLQSAQVAPAPAPDTPPVAVNPAQTRQSAPSFELVLDPEDREEFKKQRYGVRPTASAETSIDLYRALPDDDLQETYAARRSVREFMLKPVPFDSLAQLLGGLHSIQLKGNPKYRYASAGGLYPVRVYLYAKAGRVQSLSPGIYYYHPIDHTLVTMAADATLDRNIHDWINRPIFDQSAFSIFFIACYKAISPLYGSLARDFCLFEAGSMSQLLMTEAPKHQIGLCGIGSMEFESIRPLFGINEEDELLHSMAGGLIDPSRPDTDSVNPTQLGNSERVTDMLRRLDHLSKEEVETMLREKRQLTSRKE
ncbi:MAG TPA: AMP-binding protein, partial [Blastocatellia bacterium]|nr:AMP-binding protein [Blastocatellia bacterium]